MGLATGGHVMTCRDDDVIVPPSNDNILRMHSGLAAIIQIVKRYAKATN